MDRCNLKSRYDPEEWLMSLIGFTSKASTQFCVDKSDLDIMECHLTGTSGIVSDGLKKCFQMAFKSLVVAYRKVVLVVLNKMVEA